MADIKSETKTTTPETEPKAVPATVAAAPKAQTAAVETPAVEKASEPARASEKAATPAPAAVKATSPAPAAAKAAKPAPAAKKAAKPVRAAKKAKPAARTVTAKAAPAPAAKAAPARRARKALPVTKKPAAKPVTSVTTAAIRTVTKAARPAIKTLNEGPRTMKNETTKIADRVQAVFGDVNARAKDAFERNTRVAEELTDLTKGNVEAIVASGKLAAKGVESLGQEVAEFGRKSFEDASAAFKGFAEVKSPTDFFRLQSEFARAQFDSFVSESSKLSETVLKLAGEVAEPITSRYSVAAEKVKAVTAF
jgi:phasin family protein